MGRDLPANVRASVVVEDDEGASDSGSVDLTVAATQCSNSFFNCTSDGSTEVTSTPVNNTSSPNSSVWPWHGGGGGGGGIAKMITSISDLPSGAYCYGLGQAGGHNDTNSRAGGASTTLRTCADANQTDATGVLLIAGGGGGGGAASVANGGTGNSGGLAFSATLHPCGSAGRRELMRSEPQ